MILPMLMKQEGWVTFVRAISIKFRAEISAMCQKTKMPVSQDKNIFWVTQGVHLELSLSAQVGESSDTGSMTLLQFSACIMCGDIAQSAKEDYH